MPEGHPSLKNSQLSALSGIVGSDPSQDEFLSANSTSSESVQDGSHRGGQNNPLLPPLTLTSAALSGNKAREEHVKKRMIYAGLALLTALLVFPSWHLVSSLMDSTREDDYYSVVFDAGSTGSRVFVFHFKTRGSNDPDGLGVRLEEEVFQSVEPGISFYAQKPHEAAESLQPLLSKAVSSVPEWFHPYTLLTLKATAGLRLLPPSKGDRIMKAVQDLMITSPFFIPFPSNITIMNGAEEGLFGWVTLNFILDSLWDENQENTVAAFDLGGGSTQITFEIFNKKRVGLLCDMLANDLYVLKLLHSAFLVYSHSYLGYGLKSARLRIMGGKEETDDDIGEVKPLPVLSTNCLQEGMEISWIHGDVNYTVIGKRGKSVDYRPCLKSVSEFVSKVKFYRHRELHHQELHLFSYYFDVAHWAGLIPWNEHAYTLTAQHYLEAAKEKCKDENFSPRHPFLCMDVLYVYTLLTEGMGLPQDKQLHVENRLLGREVSWTLGAALSSLSPAFSYEQFCDNF